jgi:hypothetical protein
MATGLATDPVSPLLSVTFANSEVRKNAARVRLGAEIGFSSSVRRRMCQ